MITDRDSNGGCDPSTFDATLITSYKVVTCEARCWVSPQPQPRVDRLGGDSEREHEHVPPFRMMNQLFLPFFLRTSLFPSLLRFSSLPLSLTLHHLSTYDICRHSRIPKRGGCTRRAAQSQLRRENRPAGFGQSAGKTGREKSGKRMIRNCSTSTINGLFSATHRKIHLTLREELLWPKLWLKFLFPPGNYFDFYIVCTIYLNGTNCMRMSLNFVPLVVHCILNMLFPLVKLFVANGDEHPHYSWKKQNTTQQYCSLLVPPGAASNCRKGVSILYLFNTIWRKIQVYLVRILGPFHWQ